MTDIYPDFDKLKAIDLIDHLHVSPIKIAEWIVGEKLKVVGFLDPDKIKPKIKTAAELVEAEFNKVISMFVREIQVALWAWRDEMGRTGGTDLEKIEHIEQQINDGLRFLVFDRDSFEKLINENTPPPVVQPTENQVSTVDIEKIIRGVQVGVESDGNLKIRPPGKPFKIITSDMLGFKAKNKTWRELIKIISLDPPLFRQGPSSDGKTYDARRKMRAKINEKLVSTFRTHFNLQIPPGVNMFEQVKGEETGLFRLKLNVYGGKVNKKEDDPLLGPEQLPEKMSKSKLLRTIKELSDKHEIDPSNTEAKNRLINAVAVALDHGLITNEKAREILAPSAGSQPTNEQSRVDTDSSRFFRPSH